MQKRITFPQNKSKGAKRKRKELRKLTWLSCTFPDSAEYPFLHGGRRGSWLPRENTRECEPVRAWRTRRQHTSQGLQARARRWLMAKGRCRPAVHFILKGRPCQRIRCLSGHIKCTDHLFKVNWGWDELYPGWIAPCFGFPDPFTIRTKQRLADHTRPKNKSRFQLASELSRNLSFRHRETGARPHRTYSVVRKSSSPCVCVCVSDGEGLGTQFTLNGRKLPRCG